MTLPRLCLVVVSALTFVAPLSARSIGDPCPDRGVKLEPAQEVGSEKGADCGNGIAFTFNGVAYEPSDDRCPRWLEYTPSRQVPDSSTIQEGFRPVFNNTVDVMRQDYSCVGVGCGLLWLEGCCEPQGAPMKVNQLDNWFPERCDSDRRVSG